MSRPHYKIIVSDLHLGPGPFLPDGNRNILEEFHYDPQFSEWLEYYCEGNYGKAEVELILNGDILNHLAVSPEDPDCDTLTESIVLDRTQAILDGHPQFFDALAAFTARANRSIIYLMGNHDIGIAWPKVQKLLKERVGGEIRFCLDSYVADGMHIEHGNRFLIDNRVDLDNLFLTRGEPEPVLKMPWGNFFVIHFINPLKKERPYVGRVFPFKMYLRWALVHDTFFAIKSVTHLIFYFLKLNFIRDPKRSFSLMDTSTIVREFSFPQSLDRGARKILSADPGLRFVSFGHTHHEAYFQFAPGKEYINTGCWNEMIGLDVGSLGRHLKFPFAEIVIGSNGEFRASLKAWKGSYREVEEIL